MKETFHLPALRGAASASSGWVENHIDPKNDVYYVGKARYYPCLTLCGKLWPSREEAKNCCKEKEG